MQFIHFLKKLFPLASIMLLLSCNGKSAHQHTDTAGSTIDTTSQAITPNDSAAKDPGTSLNDAPKGNTESQIKSQYAEIMHSRKHGRLDSTTFRYSCNGEKNGSVTYFSDQGKLRLITHSYNEYDHFSSEDQYFVEEGKAYFVYQRSVSWSFESGPEGSTKDNITERRLYLSNNVPFKCLEKKFTIRSKSSSNPHPEQIANKLVDCSWAGDTDKEFKLLAGYYNKTAPQCLN